MLLAVLTAVVLAADPLPGEASVVSALHAEGGWLRAGSAAVSAATGSVPVGVAAAVVGVLLLARHRVGAAGVVLASVGAALLLGVALKSVVERPRPDLAEAAEVSPYAYPSGHTTASTALVLALVAVHRARSSWLVAGAGVVVATALAQLVLGRHHPADLVAGWLLAAVCVGCAELVRRRSSRPGAPRRTPSGPDPDSR